MVFTTTADIAFTGYYADPAIVTASDWIGTVSLYTEFPGTAVAAFSLTLDVDEMQLLIPLESIANLRGLYYMVVEMSSVTVNTSASRTDFLQVNSPLAIGSDKTLITMTIAKVDGTPAGKETSKITNTTTGVTITLGWQGVKVTATHNAAYNIDTEIVGTETVSTETNAAGYAQLAVIKGSTVTVTCPSFGKSVTVDTAGLDTIDLSTYF